MNPPEVTRPGSDVSRPGARRSSTPADGPSQSQTRARRWLVAGRVAVGVIGCLVLIWAAVLASTTGEPLIVLFSGLAFLIVALVGNDWQKFNAKMGGAEVSVERQPAEVVAEVANEDMQEVVARVRDDPLASQELIADVDRLAEQSRRRLEAAAGSSLSSIITFPRPRNEYLIRTYPSLSARLYNDHQLEVQAPWGQLFTYPLAPGGYGATAWPNEFYPVIKPDHQGNEPGEYLVTWTAVPPEGSTPIRVATHTFDPSKDEQRASQASLPQDSKTSMFKAVALAALQRGLPSGTYLEPNDYPDALIYPLTDHHEHEQPPRRQVVGVIIDYYVPRPGPLKAKVDDLRRNGVQTIVHVSVPPGDGNYPVYAYFGDSGLYRITLPNNLFDGEISTEGTTHVKGVLSAAWADASNR